MRSGGEGREDATQESAPPGLLVALWRTVSWVHRKIARRAELYVDSAEDKRLGDQLTLLTMLHDWMPVTSKEADELTALLASYVRGEAEADQDDSAILASDLIRSMFRARATPRRGNTQG